MHQIQRFTNQGTAATARENLLLNLAAAHPEVTFVGVQPGNPTVYLVKVGQGTFNVSLSQVEPFAAGIRAAFAAVSGTPVDPAHIAGHVFP